MNEAKLAGVVAYVAALALLAPSTAGAQQTPATYTCGSLGLFGYIFGPVTPLAGEDVFALSGDATCVATDPGTPPIFVGSIEMSGTFARVNCFTGTATIDGRIAGDDFSRDFNVEIPLGEGTGSGRGTAADSYLGHREGSSHVFLDIDWPNEDNCVTGIVDIFAKTSITLELEALPR